MTKVLIYIGISALIGALAFAFIPHTLTLSQNTISNIANHICSIQPHISHKRALTLVQAASDLGAEYHISPYLALAIIWQETTFRNIYGDNGKALGYCQIHKATYDWLQLYYPQLSEIKYSDLIRLPITQVELIYMHITVLLKLNHNNIYMAISKYNGNTVADSKYTKEVFDKIEQIKKWVYK